MTTDNVRPFVNVDAESSIDRGGRPFFYDCPSVYEPNHALIEALNQGEPVTEAAAFGEYFQNIEEKDPEYMVQIKSIVANRAQLFPDSSLTPPRLRLIIPAYREGENMPRYLESMKQQFEQAGTDDTGVTFVIDYAIPHKNHNEEEAEAVMTDAVHTFLTTNPQYSGRVDYIAYTRAQDTPTPLLPVGLARKVGEDVIMYESWQNGQKNGKETKPLYIGQMDIDADTMTPGLFGAIARELPGAEDTNPTIVRVRGSFNKQDVKANPHLHPLQMMWEGATSKVGEHTKHNPFTIGRLSVIPARELAVTGGGFAKKLDFPDEDIRKGIQIGWYLDNVDVVEVEGKYSTSARRELYMMNTLMQMSNETGGNFNLAILKCAALIDMYGDWAKNTYRKQLGNVTVYDTKDAFMSSEYFHAPLPPALIEQMANAFYRFTTFSIFAVDSLADHPETPEVAKLKNRFLRGEIPYFQVQLDTMAFIYQLVRTDPSRFEKLKPLLAHADRSAQQAIVDILLEHNVDFTVLNREIPFYGIQEALLKKRPQDGKQTDEEQRADQTPLHLRFKIGTDQTAYMQSIKRELEQAA